MLAPNIEMKGEFSQFEDVLKDRFHQTKKFAAGETIYSVVDDRSKICYYVLKGLVSYEFLHESGNSKLSTLRGKATIFPLYYTFASTAVERTLDVVAVKDTELLVIPKKDLCDLMQEIPAIALQMCDVYAEYLTYVLYSMESQLFDSVRIRVCSFLYLHCDDNGKLNMTHEQIGKAAGTTRENATRILSDLQNEGILTTRRGHIEIHCKDKLLEQTSYVASMK